VTCFERRSESGGIWAYSEDPTITSVTKYTSAQLSKYMVCYSSSKAAQMPCMEFGD
jgi:dimethylaniline monooxygenase (N-oxide forming)